MQKTKNLEKLNTDSKFVDTDFEKDVEKFFQFGLPVDCVVLGYKEHTLKVLLIKRGEDPFKGQFALPGDLMRPLENIDIAARRVLKGVTGMDNSFMHQTKLYGELDRDPTGRVFTTGYYSLIDIAKHDPRTTAWTDKAYWVNSDKLPELAFDHSIIVKDAIEILKSKIRHTPISFELLPKKFTLAQLQELYELLLNENFDKANFRRRILSQDVLIDLEEMQKGVSHRPARLYSFDSSRYEKLKAKGFSFEL